MAIEYCYRARESSPDTYVLWVHVSNSARLELSYREIANRLKIPGRDDPRESVFQLVYSWLCDEKKGKWLLVLDNLDDESLLREPLQAHSQNAALHKPFLAFLPRSSHGAILLTTRNEKVARMIVNECDIFRIEPMIPEFAISLAQKKLSIETTEEYVKDLVETLEYMPLAIVQATSYIRHASLCSVRHYLKIFRKNHRILDYDGEQPQRDLDSSNSILVTWQISFDYIQRNRSSAANLLSLMSFFDRQGIPKRFLQGVSKIGNSNPGATSQPCSDTDDSATESDGPDDDLDFYNDILALRDFSFISINQNREMLEMHRLVQLALRDWLNTQEQFEYWNAKFIELLCSAIPQGEFDDPETWRQLYPHVKSSMSQRPGSEVPLLKWAYLLYRAARYARRSGNATDMKRFASKSRAEREKLLGPEDVSTLRSLRGLGVAYFEQGRLFDAEALQVALNETIKRVLGESHSLSIPAGHDLAKTLKDLGKLEEAEKLQVEVFEKSRQVNGEDEHDTIVNAFSLASMYDEQGKHELADDLRSNWYETCKRVLGEDHPTTIGYMSNIASAYIRQGRWQDAEPLLAQSLDKCQKHFGNQHPDTLTVMLNMAEIHERQERWDMAEKLYLHVIALRKEVLGEKHFRTLTALNQLGIFYQNSQVGRYSEAVDIHEKVIDGFKEALGQNHLSTLTSQNNLSAALREQGRLEEAAELGLKTLESMMLSPGEDHPNTIITRNNLLMTYQRQRRPQAIYSLVEKGSTVHIPSLTRMPIPGHSGDTWPSETYYPRQPRDIFEVFSVLRQCGSRDLPRHIVLQIVDQAQYWISDRACRKETLCVSEANCQGRTPYLVTELVHGLRYPIMQIILSISSHFHQESSDNEDQEILEIEQACFEIEIERPDAKDHDPILVRMGVRKRLHACSKAHRVVASLSPGKSLEAGDKISIIPIAPTPGWMVFVKSACIDVQMTCLLSDEELSRVP